MIRLALVTGATSGIGRACVQLLLSKGIAVMGTGRDVSALEALQHQGAMTCVQDLQQGSAPLLTWIEKEKPDLLIHAAGFGAYGHALSQPSALFAQMLHLHATVAWELSCAVARPLIADKRPGVICHISSFAGEVPTPGMASYGASKACLTHLCQSLDQEWAAQGVRVLVCCPGMVRTPFAARALHHPFHPPRWTMKPESVAKQLWQQIMRRKSKTIIDGRYRLVHWLLPFIPKRFIAQIIFNSVMRR